MFNFAFSLFLSFVFLRGGEDGREWEDFELSCYDPFHQKILLFISYICAINDKSFTDYAAPFISPPKTPYKFV